MVLTRKCLTSLQLSKRSLNDWKKSLRSICLGAITSVSISAPLPCTPSLYDPNVHIFPPVTLASASVFPFSILISYIHCLTSLLSFPNTKSLISVSSHIRIVYYMLTSTFAAIHYLYQKRHVALSIGLIL